MNPHSNPQTSKKPQIDTTLSAKLLQKSKQNNSSRPTISPFRLQQIQPSGIGLHPQESKQLKAVKDINYQYIQLFHSIFKDNKQLMKLFYLKSDVLSNPTSKLDKEQRYQLESMKKLKSVQQSIQKMKQIRQNTQKWKKLEQFIYLKTNNEQKKLTKQELTRNAIALVTNFKQIDNKLNNLQQQYKIHMERDISNPQYLQNIETNKLTKIEKNFKKSQRKLSKLMNQQQYYQQKCKHQQQMLQAMEKKIKRFEADKQNIQMKIIGDKSRNDRLIRKNRDKKQQRSFTPAHQKQVSNNKTIRSKSSNKIILSQYQKNKLESAPSRKTQFF